jgi:2-oxoglutarate ferredoxin oxidoreductase subunit alpha
MAKAVEQLDNVIIRFAGDSGDGMQLTGDRFTTETAIMGNDLSTLPDFPAEIRAPPGSLPGVSGFQLHFADHEILTPGDAPNVLVAMNPAALKTNVGDLPKGGVLIVDTDTFKERNLQKAGYASSPLEDGSLADYHVHEVALTSMTVGALKGIEGITSREAERSKNFFALGLMSWLYNRPTEGTLDYVEKKFGKRPEIAQANATAFKAGYAYGETSEDFAVSYEIAPAKMPPGVYRQISGNNALAYGLIAASKLSGLDLFLGAYPITPASSILEELARHKSFGVRTFQAEDEIAAVGAALGAAFGGSLGVTTSAGPGIVLKQETIGLGIMLELPLLILDIQRAGPSTGMPTKPEQGDLLMVMFGRNSESPVPVIAASSPSQCFHAAIEAARIAIKYRTPVYLLSDAYLANGSEPWLIPSVADLPDISTEFVASSEGEFMPYQRDPETLARPWAIPGTPGLEHRIGGLEKADVTGSISYDPENHDLMTRLRAAKVAGIANDIPLLEVDDPDGDADTLVLGWGSTYGPIAAGVKRVRRSGHKVARAHLHYLNPFPRNTGVVLRSYDKILIPEMNLGQLLKLVRAEFLVDAIGYNRVRGLPFKASELEEAITALVES